MGISTYIIELRVEFADESKQNIVLDLVRQSARDLYAASQMLKDKREPQISLMTGDMFEKNEDLSILTPEGEEGDTPRGE